MDNARLNTEIERLRRNLGPRLCEDRPCRRIGVVTIERAIYPDGSEEVIGEPPPPLCSACPERANPTPRIRTLEVVRDLRGAHRDAHIPETPAQTPAPPQEQAAAPTLSDPGGNGLPVPPAWGPDHPGHPDFREDSAPRRRSPSDHDGPVIRPEDFGLPRDFDH